MRCLLFALLPGVMVVRNVVTAVRLLKRELLCLLCHNREKWCYDRDTNSLQESSFPFFVAMVQWGVMARSSRDLHWGPGPSTDKPNLASF